MPLNEEFCKEKFDKSKMPPEIGKQESKNFNQCSLLLFSMSVMRHYKKTFNRNFLMKLFFILKSDKWLNTFLK